jgi:hypothetical protein
MIRMKTFNCTIEETHTLEVVKFEIKSTSEDSAYKYCQVIADNMPSQTIHYTEEDDKETYWYVDIINQIEG